MSTPVTASASEIVAVISLVSMCVHELKGLNLGEENLHLGLYCGVGLTGRCKFGCVLGGGGCAFVLVDLEVHHNLIYDGVGVVEAQFVNPSASFPEFKVSFTEVVLEVIPCFVRHIGEFPRLDVVFESSLSVEDNKGKVYCLTLG